ncbi:MAG: CapA family protein [Bacteroidales bacterium]|jgi:poly-gamma-glutamate synthesis protein (capsule biosynthesis protein)|nr:CapA family protein [Bacteroidales bacterium]
MIKFFACGDIVNKSGKHEIVEAELQHIISSCDISICNFEAPIYTQENNAISKAGPHVYQYENSIITLKNIGFNILSLANNHIYDYGDLALKNTLDIISKQGLLTVGAGKNFDDTYTPTIIEKNNIKIGILAACENEFGCLAEDENRSGYAWINHYKIDDTIRKIKSEVDFIIFIAHTGVESIDVPLPEWRDRYKRLCDLGANAVIGHHPHVPQGIEQYNDSVIFYSLGNFYFDTVGFENKTDDSFSVVLNIKKNKNIDYELVYHKKVNNQTTLSTKESTNFSIEYLNNKLKDNYKEYINKLTIDLYNSRYLPYYQSALNAYPTNKSFLKKIFYFVKLILFQKRNTKERSLLLLHNIRIESHRFIVQRALSLLYEKNNDE